MNSLVISPLLLAGVSLACQYSAVDSPRSRQPVQTLYVREKPTRLTPLGTVSQEFLYPLVLVSHDGKKIVAGGALRWEKFVPVTTWETDTWRVLRVFDVPEGSVCVSISSDAEFIAMGRVNQSNVDIWEASSGTKVRTLLSSPVRKSRPQMAFTRAAFSHDGKLLATARRLEETIDIWDTTTWETLKAIEHINRHTSRLTFSTDNRTLAITQQDPRHRDSPNAHFMLRLVDVKAANGAANGICTLNLDALDISVSFAPDGTKFATGARVRKSEQQTRQGEYYGAFSLWGKEKGTFYFSIAIRVATQ